ncbi:MAG: hypothetical protein H0Z37_02465 [Firmicutes bacterium]|nr:hypothetical protein [Bacillota bacterium]
MIALSVAVACLSLTISLVSLAVALRARADARLRARLGTSRDDELLRDAWLEEIESRGQAALERIAEAEARAVAAHRWASPLAQTSPGNGAGQGDRARAEPETGDGDASARRQRLWASVNELLDQGLDPAAVAQKLGIGRDEVELIRGLSRAGRS